MLVVTSFGNLLGDPPSGTKTKNEKAPDAHHHRSCHKDQYLTVFSLGLPAVETFVNIQHLLLGIFRSGE